jgi:hypothetical protein
MSDKILDVPVVSNDGNVVFVPFREDKLRFRRDATVSVEDFLSTFPVGGTVYLRENSDGTFDISLTAEPLQPSVKVTKPTPVPVYRPKPWDGVVR